MLGSCTAFALVSHNMQRNKRFFYYYSQYHNLPIIIQFDPIYKMFENSHEITHHKFLQPSDFLRLLVEPRKPKIFSPIIFKSENMPQKIQPANIWNSNLIISSQCRQIPQMTENKTLVCHASNAGHKCAFVFFKKPYNCLKTTGYGCFRKCHLNRCK